MNDHHDDDLINKADADYATKRDLHQQYDPDPNDVYVAPRTPQEAKDPVRTLLRSYIGEDVLLVGSDGQIYAVWSDGGRGRGNKRGHVFSEKVTREQYKRLLRVEVPFAVRYVL